MNNEQVVTRNDVPATPSRDRSTERVRRHRERKRQGLMPVTVVVNSREIRELIRLGWLNRDELVDRQALAEAVRGILGAAFDIGAQE